LVGGAILAACAIAAYCRTFSVPLLLDDLPSIAENPSIRHWSSALWPPVNSTTCGRPVLNLSLAVNYAISGTALWSYHLANLAIHALAGLTLFGIIRRMLAPQRVPNANLVAFSAALFWTLHPLQTEAVTYVVQRAESLMGLFYLLTVYGFIRYAEEQSTAGPIGGAPAKKAAGPGLWAALSVLACILGMATKEVMASAPLMVLLYDRTFLAGSFREAWRRRWRVYAGLAATWLIPAILVPSTHGRNGTAGFGSGVSWWGYALTQFPSIVRYLRLSVWPHPLVFDYGTEWVRVSWAILLPAAVVLGLAGASAWALFRPGLFWRSLGFAGVWFFAILAPTSLIPGNRQTAAEHRMYLALIPVAVLGAIGIYRWLGRAALPVSLALGALLFGLTVQRNEQYRSEIDLWRDTVAEKPGNPWAHNSLGVALERIPGRLNEAIVQWKEALRLKPDLAEAHNDLGNALGVEGRIPEAIAQYEEALRVIPNVAEVHNNLGYLLSSQPGRRTDAIAQYEEALRLKPDFAKAHLNLGNALIPEGRTQEAIAQYEAALRVDPDYAEAHSNLGVALQMMPGRINDAIAQYKEALRLKPDYAEAHGNLGVALETIPGRMNDAIAQYEEALRLNPDFAAIHLRIAMALLKSTGRGNEARAHLETVLRLQPGNQAARQVLESIQASRP
jgi:tetratricopeptide (TPR) repeat protein